MAVTVTVTVANSHCCIYYHFYLFTSSYSYENKWALRSGLSFLYLFTRTSANPGNNFFDGGKADLRVLGPECCEVHVPHSEIKIIRLNMRAVQ